MFKKHKILPSRILKFIEVVSTVISILTVILNVSNWISAHIQLYFIILLVLFVFYLIYLVRDVYDELQSSEDNVKKLKNKCSRLSKRIEENRSIREGPDSLKITIKKADKIFLINKAEINESSENISSKNDFRKEV